MAAPNEKSSTSFQQQDYPESGWQVVKGSWYDCWIQRQIHQHLHMVDALTGDEHAENGKQLSWFWKLWHAVARLLSEDTGLSVDGLIPRLVDMSFFDEANGKEYHQTAQDLIFAILGWQTMLYRPECGSCHESQFAIVDETDGYRGQGHLNLKQNRVQLADRLSDMLLGFGVMLPPAGLRSMDLPAQSSMHDCDERIDPRSFNAKIITTIGGLSIRWVESLACHLEFDIASKTVFLFQFPGFCILNLAATDAESSNRAPIFFCATNDEYASNWATRSEITDILEEILLSFRVLFGQTEGSRRFFRKVNPFEGMRPVDQDTCLAELCTSKQPDLQHRLREHSTYILSRDFPHYQSRLSRLVQHIHASKPRTWREMWADKRDSAGWWTFWAVLMIGGSGLLLAFMQVILQIVQIVIQARTS